MAVIGVEIAKRTEHNCSPRGWLIWHDNEYRTLTFILRRTGNQRHTMNTTLLFTIAISSSSRDNRQIYSAQAIATNGEPLYRLAEGGTVSEALEQVVQQMRQQEKHSASYR